MLIKTADDRSAELARLEAAIALANEPRARKRLQADLAIRKAGLKGEAESTYHIDFHFAQSPNWAVIHDLRIEYGGRVAQVDHLLVNRWLEIYVLETKHFHSGLKITEEGEFLRWSDYRKTYEGMASPLLQNDRHITVLEEAVESIELPRRLGFRLKPKFQTLVLVSPTARVDRPQMFDSTRVIKADQLRQRIWKDIDDEGVLSILGTIPKLVASETVERLARALVALHRPLVVAEAGLRAEPDAHGVEEQAPVADREPQIPRMSGPSGPGCKHCAAINGQILHGKFGYYFKCAGCQGNTAIRFTCEPGHKPRLRKQGLQFFRECGDCGTTTLFHTNSGTEACSSGTA